MKFYGKLSLILLASYFILSYLRVNFLPKRYIFDNVRLQEICQGVLADYPGANSTVILEQAHIRIKKEYPDWINDMREEDWVFNNAGNAMGSMIILHASITEYLIFFGSATGTEGHTGTHWSDDYFIILHGQENAAPAHAREPEVYLPGDNHHLHCGKTKQYSMPADSWALELAQGWIPSMLPFGFLDTLTSTMDLYSFFKTVKMTAYNMGANLLRGKL